MTRLFTAASLLLMAEPAFAHDDGTALGSAARSWNHDPWLLLPLCITAALFLIGCLRLWHRAGPGRGITYEQAACFWAGWALVAVALASPLHALSERMLTAHMIEHELLMVGAAPLLVLSRPLTGFLWSLPIEMRRRLATLAGAPPIAVLWLVLTNASAATLLHIVTVFAWHMPSMFEAAIQNPFLHKLQHASFLVTALFFWWALLRLPRRQYGAGALHLFATMMAVSLLGALLALSSKLWYPSYSVPLLGITPLEDQQLAGLVMWIPGCSVYAVATLLFLAVLIASGGPQQLPLAKAGF
jgi:putative membrane protein